MIRKTVLLPCPPARAFDLFTQRAGDWWPSDRRHTKDPSSLIRMEAGGRFFERASDGKEAELGVVRTFEPPRLLVLDWFPGTGPQQPTHVEVRFEPEGADTRVIVEHREGPLSREVYPQRVAAYDQSWTLVLEALSRAAA